MHSGVHSALYAASGGCLQAGHRSTGTWRATRQCSRLSNAPDSLPTYQLGLLCQDAVDRESMCSWQNASGQLRLLPCARFWSPAPTPMYLARILP